MSSNVPRHPDIERVILITVDCLRWDHYDPIKAVFPPGVWYRGTTQGTHTSIAHASLFTGANPPRHQYGAFGQQLALDDTVFDLAHSASAGELTHPAYELFPHVHADHQSEFRSTEWVTGDHDESCLDIFVEADLGYYHDWTIHASTTVDNRDDWGPPTTTGNPVINHAHYASYVELSAAVHGRVFDVLKDKGLYENTLFFVWGDHGQGLEEPPFKLSDHGHFPEEGHARVPMGFCSPLFDDTSVDIQTNPRAVDVLPTLQSVMDHANLRMRPPTHEVEGVDLTTFDGRLAGYTATNAGADGIRTSDVALFQRDGETTLTETYPERQDDYRLQHVVDDHPLAETLVTAYETVRTEPTALVQ